MTAGRERGRMGSLFFATMYPQTIVSMITVIPPVMADTIGRHFGLPVEATGLFTGLLYGFVLLGNMLSSRFIDRLGPLRLSFVCVVTAGFGLALFGSGWLAGLLVATAVIGMSYGPLTPASSQVMAGHAGSPAFALMVSIRQTSVPLGGMLAGLVTPALLLRFGWQATCELLGLALAAASALFLLASPLIRRERAPPGDRRRFGLLAPLILVAGRRSLLTLAASSFLYGAIQLTLSTFLVAYLTTVVGHDLVTAGALLGASQLAGVCGRILWGTIADRYLRPRTVMVLIGIGTAASCGLTALLAGLGPTAATLPVTLLFGATASGWNGVFLAEIMREVEPAEAGLATSGSLLFTYAGIVLGPLAFGGFAALAGLPAAFEAGGLLALVGAFLARPPRRPGRT